MKIENFVKSFKKEIPDIRPGDEVRIFQKISASAPALAPALAGQKATAGKKEGEKERTQMFEGIVIAEKHRKEMGATITVRREISGVGVERIFPIYLPTIEKIEILKRGKVRRAKLYYLRKLKGKRAKLRTKEIAKAIANETSSNKTIENKETKGS